MGRPWARSDPGCAKQRARIAHCLMLRLRRWARAYAHDPAHAQGRTGKPNTVSPRDRRAFEMTYRGSPRSPIGAKRSVGT